MSRPVPPRGVAVTNTPGVLDAATADLALALILATCDAWSSPTPSSGPGGGDGLGLDDAPRPGGERRDARHRRPRAGSAAVVAQGTRLRDASALHEARALADGRGARARLDYRDLDDLLREADIVTVHVPLTDETGAAASTRGGSGSCTTARASSTRRAERIVDETGARRRSSPRAGSERASTSSPHEPNVPPELLELPNVVLTPHLGSATQETREAMTRVLVDNLQAAEAGRPLPNPVYAFVARGPVGSADRATDSNPCAEVRLLACHFPAPQVRENASPAADSPRSCWAANRSTRAPRGASPM